MNLEEIRVLAQTRGLNPGKLSKRDLIRAIQQGEGNFACFATAFDGICDQLACTWRQDCFREAKRLMQAQA